MLTSHGVSALTFITHPIAKEAWKAVEEQAEVIRPKATTRSDFIRECQTGHLDGVVALYRAAITVAGKFDAELVGALPQSLRFVCYTGLFQRSAGCKPHFLGIHHMRRRADFPKRRRLRLH